MPDWLSQTAIGAVVGSGLSVWWRRAIRWQVNLASGVFVGWWGGDFLIAQLSLPPNDAYERAIGGGLGIIGFSIMEGLVTVPWAKLMRKTVDKLVQSRLPREP